MLSSPNFHSVHRPLFPLLAGNPLLQLLTLSNIKIIPRSPSHTLRMFSLKALLFLTLLSTTLASPLLLPRQCADTCGSTCYTQADIDNAVSTACDYLQQGSTVGHNYPHQYNDREGFSFADAGPYYEFPILADESTFSGGSPGADRVIFTGDCTYEAVITHQGVSGNAFLQCTAGS